MDLFQALLNSQDIYNQIISSVKRSLSADDLGLYWKNFIHESISLIDKLGEISTLLYKRYFDEYEKALDNESSMDGITNLLKGSIRSQLSLAHLLNIYIDYEEQIEHKTHSQNSHGVEKQNIENRYSAIFELFFKEDGYHDLVKELGKEMGELQKFHSRKRLELMTIDYSDKDEYVSNQIKNGDFYLKTLLPIIDGITQSWWVDDWMAKYWINSVATKFYTNAVEEEDNISDPDIKSKIEKIKVIELPITEGQRYLNLANMFMKLGVKITKEGDHGNALDMFQQVLKMIDKVYLHIGTFPSGEVMSNLNQNAIELSNKAKLYHQLCNMASLYNMIISSSEVQQVERVKILIDKLTDFMNVEEFDIDLQLISAMPSVYETIQSTSKLMINGNHAIAEVPDQAQYFMKNYQSRLFTSIKQLIKNLLNYTKDKETVPNLTNIEKEAKLLLDAASLLPSSMQDRERIINEVESIYFLIKSLTSENLAQSYADNDKLLELITRTQSHYYAKKALEVINKEEKEYLPHELITTQFVESFITSLTVHMQIFRYITQYQLISEVIPSLYLVFTQDVKLLEYSDSNLDELKERLNQDELFKSSIESIMKSCDKLENFKERALAQNHGIRWDKISTTSILAETILLFYEGIKEVTMASLSHELGMVDEAVIQFNDAQKASFDASYKLDELSELESDNRLKDTANQIFQFGQFCQNVSNNIQSFEKSTVPFREVFKLFRTLIFAL